MVKLAYSETADGTYVTLEGLVDVDLPDEWTTSRDAGGMREPGEVTFRYKSGAERFAAVQQLLGMNLHWRAAIAGIGSYHFPGYVTHPGAHGPDGVGEAKIQVGSAPRFERA